MASFCTLCHWSKTGIRTPSTTFIRNTINAVKKHVEDLHGKTNLEYPFGDDPMGYVGTVGNRTNLKHANKEKDYQS